MEQDYITAAGNNMSSLLFFKNQAHIPDNLYVRSGLTLVLIFIFFVCFLGNLAVSLVVTLEWKGRLLSKFYLGSLAAANLSVALFCIPQSISVHLLDRWIFGELMCKMFHFVTSLCHTVSILSLVVVSVERYMALLHPFRGPPVLTVRRLQVVLLLVWLLSAGVSLPRFFYSSLVRIRARETGTAEICVHTSSTYNTATADIVYSIVLYAIPIAVLSVIYLQFEAHIRKYEKMRSALIKNVLQFKVVSGDNYSDAVLQADSVKIACCIWGPSTPPSSEESTLQTQKIGGNDSRDSKQINQEGFARCQLDTLGIQRVEIQSSRLRSRKRTSLVRMLTSIVVTFSLLNLPFHVHKLCVNFLPTFDLSSDVNSVIAPLTYILMYANCAVNPLLYVSMSSRFRENLRELVRKFCRACSCTPITLTVGTPVAGDHVTRV